MNVTEFEFTNWLDQFSPIFNLNIINPFLYKLKSIYQYKYSTILLFLAIVLFLLILINYIINKYIMDKVKERKDNKNTFYNSIRLKDYKVKNSIIFYFNIVKRSKYFKRKMKYLTGPMSYWIIIGLNLGLLYNIEIESKVFYFILSAHCLFPIYLLVENLYENLFGIYSMEGENKNIILWRNKPYKLLYSKFILYFSNLIIVILLSNVILYYKGVSFILAISILFLQLTFIIFLFLLFNYIGSDNLLVFYSNIEEALDNSIKSYVNNIVKIVLYVIFIPVSLLPTALYMTNLITNKLIFQIIQYNVLTIILLILSIIIFYKYKNKLNLIFKKNKKEEFRGV